MQQAMAQNYMAYDRTIVVFSPDGRLLQVEYARQAVKRGSTAVGVSAQGVVVLGATKSSTPLSVETAYKKIFPIDKHVGVVSAGLLADARNLVEMARVRAQINSITYGEPISVKTITKHLADQQHMVTQYAGLRPYGVGLLIGWVDKSGGRLFETDPSGTMLEWKAQAIGKGADKAKKYLKSNYKDGMAMNDAIKVVVNALKTGENIGKENIELAVITRGKFDMCSGKEIGKFA
jgi:proteasome alpha subunit